MSGRICVPRLCYDLLQYWHAYVCLSLFQCLESGSLYGGFGSED